MNWKKCISSVIKGLVAGVIVQNVVLRIFLKYNYTADRMAISGAKAMADIADEARILGLSSGLIVLTLFIIAGIIRAKKLRN